MKPEYIARYSCIKLNTINSMEQQVWNLLHPPPPFFLGNVYIYISTQGTLIHYYMNIYFQKYIQQYIFNNEITSTKLNHIFMQ